MGCHDIEEVFELVRSYLPNKLTNIVDKKYMGLYRNHGLAILQNLLCPQIERKPKDLIKMFKTAGLNITIQAGLHFTSFLDLPFSLNSGMQQPSEKLENTPV